MPTCRISPASSIGCWDAEPHVHAARVSPLHPLPKPPLDVDMCNKLIRVRRGDEQWRF